uniref:GDNF/GAS1 domain-containing protein n=1 Tax=Angiostrongylus cantonensis TaxID=6313 RepID=A0A158P966_ANGCA
MHDECYTHQRGRKKCDEEFCECNRRVTIFNNKCRDFLEASCSIVQIFGFVAYSNSVNYTEPVNLVKYTLHSDHLKFRYSDIYGLCPKVNGEEATLSSCALQHNLCKNSAAECAASLSQCLREAATVDGSTTCHGAVEAMCKATFEGEGMIMQKSDLVHKSKPHVPLLAFVSMRSRSSPNEEVYFLPY